MNLTPLLSTNSRSTPAVLLLILVAVEYSGWFMLRVVWGRQPATPFQHAFFLAGDAHMSGMLAFFARTSI
jgi:hypothetical protein